MPSLHRDVTGGGKGDTFSPFYSIIFTSYKMMRVGGGSNGEHSKLIF